MNFLPKSLQARKKPPPPPGVLAVVSFSTVVFSDIVFVTLLPTTVETLTIHVLAIVVFYPSGPDVIPCGWLGSKHQLTYPCGGQAPVCDW